MLFHSERNVATFLQRMCSMFKVGDVIRLNRPPWDDWNSYEFLITEVNNGKGYYRGEMNRVKGKKEGLWITYWNIDNDWKLVKAKIRNIPTEPI